jgi:hypothetical protein
MVVKSNINGVIWIKFQNHQQSCQRGSRNGVFTAKTLISQPRLVARLIGKLRHFIHMTPENVTHILRGLKKMSSTTGHFHIVVFVQSINTH